MFSIQQDNSRSSSHRYLRNERGQIAIFIALIFNILFVFFAMVINVGMLVHDKINLQNAVDLAAYYAAAKQAEQLNAIAHTNYQIRQSWKLLSWRIRALGDLGRDGHPLHPNSSGTTTFPELPFNSQAVGKLSSVIGSSSPIVCIGHTIWADGSGVDVGGRTNQNLCANSVLNVAKIPDIPNFAPFLSINGSVQDFGKQQALVYKKSCESVGAFDWALAARWYLGYRYDIQNKKKIIRQIADQLSQQTDDFKDVIGGSARDGALLTLKNNLTRANLDGLKDSDVYVFNSLGSGDWTAWLHEIFIYPLILYADIANDATGCNGKAQFLNGPTPTDPRVFAPPTGTALASQLDPGRHMHDALAEPGALNAKSINSLSHSSAGYEKNPWYPAYVGFKATTRVRKPFAPFGGDVVLVARAFAKPFGGRIGPWMYTKWPQSESASNGGELTDMMLPLGVSTDPTTQSTTSQIFTVPNYSRFPGDTLGLASQAALGAMRSKFSGFDVPRSLSITFWGNLPEDLVKATGDVVAYTDTNALSAEQGEYKMDPGTLSRSQTGFSWIRDFELAAIAPDLFDVTYYSIDPHFYMAYGTRTAQPQNGVPPLLADLGQHVDPPEKLNDYDIAKQIAGPVKTVYEPRPNYIIEEFAHVLTGWMNAGAYNYDTSAKPELFGTCTHEPKEKGVPGCVEGGRTGYSVKLVSRSFLMDPDALSVNGSAGPLKNPPTDF